MHRRLTAAAVAATVLTLAGCGQAAGPTSAADQAAPAAATPTGSTQPVDTPVDDPVDPPVTGVKPPAWPGGSCDSPSVSSVDYRTLPLGSKTPQEAVTAANLTDIPAGDLVTGPVTTDGAATVWVVDASYEILAQVTLAQGTEGWFVDSVMTCA